MRKIQNKFSHICAFALALVLGLMGIGANLVHAEGPGDNSKLQLTVNSENVTVWYNSPSNNTKLSSPQFSVVMGFSQADGLTLTIAKDGGTATNIPLSTNFVTGSPSNSSELGSVTADINLANLYPDGYYGSYVLTATATNSVSGTSDPKTLSVNYPEPPVIDTNPRVSVISPVAGETYKGQESTQINASFTYANADSVSWTLQKEGSSTILDSYGPVSVGSATSGSSNTQINMASLASGNYIFTAYSYRTVDGTKITSTPHSVVFTYVKPYDFCEENPTDPSCMPVAAPSIAISSPTNGSYTTTSPITATISYETASKVSWTLAKDGENVASDTRTFTTDTNGTLNPSLNLSNGYGFYILSAEAENSRGVNKTASVAFFYYSPEPDNPDDPVNPDDPDDCDKNPALPTCAPSVGISAPASGSTVGTSALVGTINYDRAYSLSYSLYFNGEVIDSDKRTFETASTGVLSPVLVLSKGYGSYLLVATVTNYAGANTSTMSFFTYAYVNPDDPDDPSNPDNPDTPVDPCAVNPNLDECKGQNEDPNAPTIGDNSQHDPVINVPVDENTASVHVVVKDESGNKVMDQVIPIDPSDIKSDGTVDITLPFGENEFDPGKYSVEATPLDANGNPTGSADNEEINYNNSTTVEGKNPTVNVNVPEGAEMVRFLVYDKDNKIVLDITRSVSKSGILSFELPFEEYGITDGDYTIKAITYSRDANGNLVPSSTIEDAPSAKITYKASGSVNPPSPDTDGDGNQGDGSGDGSDSSPSAPNTGIFGIFGTSGAGPAAFGTIVSLMVVSGIAFVVIRKKKNTPAEVKIEQ